MVIGREAQRTSKLLHIEPGFALLLLLVCMASPAAGSSQKYVAEVMHDSATEWIGVADVQEEVGGRVRGEFCLVRREYITRPVLPRTLLRLPIKGRRDQNRLEFTLPELIDGPKFGGKPVILIHRDYEPDSFGAPPYWRFGNRPPSSESEERRG